MAGPQHFPEPCVTKTHDGEEARVLSEGFVWALAAGGGMIGFGIGIILTAYRHPSRRSAWNSTILAVIVGIAIIAISAWFAPPANNPYI